MIAYLFVLMSLWALLRLSWQDPKRRRVFALAPPRNTVPVPLLWGLCLLPGVILPLVAPFSGWLLWFGALCSMGWAIAATPPGTLDKFIQQLDAAGQSFERRFR